MNPRPRILLADDHRMFGEALRGLLEERFELVGVVEDGLALVEAATRLRPDAIVADIGMPGLNGLDALVKLRALQPEVRCVFLTMHREPAYARRALALGALGYVLKHSALTELEQALRCALAGKRFVTPAIAEELDRAHGVAPLADDPVATITARQRQILQLLAEGLSAKRIAARLGLSARTVEFHKYRLMEGVGAKNTTELIHYATRNGLIVD
jgi:DNA-binding NarL/FixJ family response regulator